MTMLSGRMGRALAAAALLLALAGCQTYSLVKAGAPVKAGDRMTVTPKGSWNEIGSALRNNVNDDVVMWTADSPILNQLMFVHGLENEERIFKTPASVPKFASGADNVALAEFVRATFGAVNKTTTEEIETRPIEFLGVDGVMTEFAVDFPDGAPGKALAAAAIISGKLYMISWRGLDGDYYQGRKSEVERIIESARLTGKA